MMRCPRCGSDAVRMRHLDPLPGSATVGYEAQVTCREPTCGFSVINRPEAAIATFTPRADERLDRASLIHSGYVVALNAGPPNPFDPWTQKILAEMAALTGVKA